MEPAEIERWLLNAEGVAPISELKPRMHCQGDWLERQRRIRLLAAVQRISQRRTGMLD